jgi:hypothetical protein
MKNEVDGGRLKGRVAKSLAGVISICALLAGVPSILSNSVVHFSSGLKLVIFGLIAGTSILI